MSAYPRRKRVKQLSTDFRAPFAAGIHLAENPNTGYRTLSYPTRYRLTESGPREELRRIPQL